MSEELLSWALHSALTLSPKCDEIVGVVDGSLRLSPRAATRSPSPQPLPTVHARDSVSFSAAQHHHEIRSEGLTRRSSDVHSTPTMSRANSLTTSGLKTRALSVASSLVVRHVIEIGACNDPKCIMYFDAQMFTNPLSVSSRQRLASFRRCTKEGDTVTLDDDTEDAQFDLAKVSRRLFSSSSQQSAPLQDFLLDTLISLSSAQSPIRSSPETFVMALVLLERMQHRSLLARHISPPLHTPVCSPTTAQHLAPPPCSYTPINSADDRVRNFLDDTPAVRLTVESLQTFNNSQTNSLSPSTTVGHASLSDTDSAASCMKQSGGPSLCHDCTLQEGLPLHASNVHLFFAAAVLIAIKVREDYNSGPSLLTHAASMLHCTPKSLYWAERCLCDALQFDVNVTVHEYRSMLRQLASHRSNSDQATDNYMTMFQAV